MCATNYNCEGLESIKLGWNVSEIGFLAFSGCDKLKTIYNTSKLKLEKGSLDYGKIAEHATEIYNYVQELKVYNGNKNVIQMFVDRLEEADTEATASNAIVFAEYDEGEELPANFIIDGNAKSIVLTDAEPFYCPSDVTAETITYSRTFKNTNWQSLYLPYDMAYEEWSDKASVAELAGVHMYEDKPTIIEFITVKSGSLLPNTPYVICANEAASEPVTFTSTNKTIRMTPAEETRYISCSSPRWTYKFYGNYQTLPLERVEALEAKVLGSGKLMPSSTAVKPMRFYLVKERSGNGYWGAPSRNVDQEEILVMVDGELLSSEEADAILNAFAGREDGKAYNLNGMNVGEDYKGIVIKNGKKIINK